MNADKKTSNSSFGATATDVRIPILSKIRIRKDTSGQSLSTNQKFQSHNTQETNKGVVKRYINQNRSKFEGDMSNNQRNGLFDQNIENRWKVSEAKGNLFFRDELINSRNIIRRMLDSKRIDDEILGAINAIIRETKTDASFRRNDEEDGHEKEEALEEMDAFYKYVLNKKNSQKFYTSFGRNSETYRNIANCQTDECVKTQVENGNVARMKDDMKSDPEWKGMGQSDKDKDTGEEEAETAEVTEVTENIQQTSEGKKNRSAFERIKQKT